MDILLVEDDPMDAEMTIRELKEAHVKNRIELVRDGEEALDYLFCRGAWSSRAKDRVPMLVLLDLKLPKVDGLEVLKAIKNSPDKQAMPVVVLTSSGEERDLIESYRLGVNSYIQKPVNFDQFRQAIKTLGLYWVLLNEAPPEKAFKSARH